MIASAAAACATPARPTRPTPPREDPEPIARPDPEPPATPHRPGRLDYAALRHLTDEQRLAFYRDIRDEEDQAKIDDHAAEIEARTGLSHDTAALLAELDDVDLFSIGPVGPTAMRPLVESAARVLAKRPDAREGALVLVRGLPMGSRLYGLWVLTAVDPRTAALVADDLRHGGGTVPHVSGCLLEEAPVANVVDYVLAEAPP